MVKVQTGVVHVIGGGLAGCEASWQLLRQGVRVVMHEMRPKKTTAAHKTADFAELVCSNSLKSMNSGSAPEVLKHEMQSFDSLILRAAMRARVPAGSALAVDRLLFSQYIRQELEASPLFEAVCEEVIEVPSEDVLRHHQSFCILASGPLTTDKLAQSLLKYCNGVDQLAFYDAIAPILEAESLDEQHLFVADRYGKGEGDYVNIPLSKEQYESFVDDILAAEKVPLHGFEETKYFESCLPIEVMAERGRETLRFGPLKPVGIVDPKTGQRPYANIQLRRENDQGSMLSMVGFQTKMKWPEQKRVFSKIPAFASMEFFRYGSVHRNTYVQGPKVLAKDLSLLANRRTFLAGQITGVEGYTESSAIGLIVGRLVAGYCTGKQYTIPPKNTMIGALVDYVTVGPKGDYAPMNVNLGLLPTIQKRRGVSKAERKVQQCDAAKQAFNLYLQEYGASSLPVQGYLD
ncbi:MAG: methylenetetrahydrofolate--tRNA-(uracil(54)-C(5))-methyltransferase (FADH(2)-oxidizing) TrmFO [Zetaproteobacteria bacterium]|nr:methylenetetrahydrofolate--tRNA-(uracil(54)-C(5))-methyltransferase (FADH(2)-oxidizing) TrmFO [Zetaproteobacteria bacterium]